MKKTEGNQGEQVVNMGKAAWGKANPGTNRRRKTRGRARKERKGQNDFRRTNLPGLKPPKSNGAERMREGAEAPSSADTRAN